MRIGEFANQFSVSKDTVRFYVNKGLLIPNGQGAQYVFSQRECQDMQTILKMKDQQFSLQEIREYLAIWRVSNMVEPESIQAVVDLLDGKKAELEQEAEKLRQLSESIDQDIQTILSHESGRQRRTGVPLRALPLLACPYCGGGLELKRASLNSRYIHSGLLHCTCGYKVYIENGIIKTGNLYTAPYDKPDLTRGLYRNVSEGFVTYLQRCSDFAIQELNRIGLNGKVVMEGHCNGYFFLYNHFRELQGNCIYVIQDKYPEMVEMYKRNIERLDLDLDILYIADASTSFPLKANCVDILIDFMGDNEHSLYFHNFYITDVKKYLVQKAEVIGAVLGYHDGSKSLTALKGKYPEGDASGYCKDQWDMLYAQEDFHRESYIAGVMTESCNQYSFECHRKGEELFLEYFRALPIRRKTQ